jgi:hypothetical protein
MHKRLDWLDHLPPVVANGWGDLHQIAAPDTLLKPAKQEIFMTELTQFQLRLIKSQSNAFNFERASVALLARHKCQHHSHEVHVPLRSEWRDPTVCRPTLIGSQGEPHLG